DFAAAIERAARGMACGAEGEVRGALASIQAEAHKWQGRNVEAEAHFAEAYGLFAPGTPRWLRALSELATVRAEMGAHEALLPLADELKMVGVGRDRPAYATSAARVAIQLLHTGHVDAADRILGSAEGAAARAGHEPTMTAALYQARAIRAMFWGDVGAFLG